MYSTSKSNQQTKPLPGYTGYRPQYGEETAFFALPSN